MALAPKRRLPPTSSKKIAAKSPAKPRNSMNPEIIAAAAARVGWQISASRAAQIAAAAEPTLKAFEAARLRIDFDSDALSYLAVRDAVKQREVV